MMIRHLEESYWEVHSQDIVWMGKQEVQQGILEANGGKLETVEEKSIL